MQASVCMVSYLDSVIVSGHVVGCGMGVVHIQPEGWDANNNNNMLWEWEVEHDWSACQVTGWQNTIRTPPAV